MVPDGCGGGQAQPILDGLAIFVFSSAEEAPVLVSESPEVAIFHPSLALPWMSPSCPSPQRFEDGGVDMDKGFLGRCMSVIVCHPRIFGLSVVINQYVVASLLSLMTFRMSARNAFTF